MAKIQFENKVALNENNSIADINKCKASDLNEIKQVVNDNDDLLETINNNLTNLSNYYSSEKIIGKWLNNKPIYQKMISFTVDDNTNKSIAYNIENLEEIWLDEKASFITNDNESLGINWYYSSDDWCRTWISKLNSNIRFVCPSSLGTRTCYVCLNYTKTTD